MADANTLSGTGAGDTLADGSTYNICIGQKSGPRTKGVHTKELWIDIANTDRPLIKGNFGLPRQVDIWSNLVVHGNISGATVTITDFSSLDHGGLGGLLHDDHTQYLLANGTRALTDNWDIGTKLLLGDQLNFTTLAAKPPSGDIYIKDSLGNTGLKVWHGGLISLNGLYADWDVGNGRSIKADKIRARDGDGLALYEDGGRGLFIADGGYVGINTRTPGSYLHVAGSAGDFILGDFPTVFPDTPSLIMYSTSFPGGALSAIWSLDFSTPGWDNIPLQILASQIWLTGFTWTDNYGLHVGSATDPGNNNLAVDGNVEIDGDLNHDGGNVGFYGIVPVTQRAKASHNNWAGLSDVVNALVELGLFDTA